MTMDNIIVINLIGKRFSIPYRLVADYPDTLLGNQSLLSEYYRSDMNDYYFERNSLLFPYILTYYTLDKKIFCPHNIPIELIEKECDFFQLKNPNIYNEMNRVHTYQYISRKKIFKKQNYFLSKIPVLISILLMISIGMEVRDKHPQNFNWSVNYFVELFNAILLTCYILYQVIYNKNFFQNKYFFFDMFATILSLCIIICQNLIIMTNYRSISVFIMLMKSFRLCLFIAHLRILRLIMQTFIQRFRTIWIFIFIHIITTGTFSEIAFAFERRQRDEDMNQSSMRTHFDAFWWATSLSFTIGYGYTDPHFTLTGIGRFCGYILTFFGLFFNGLILQELIKGFLEIYREERKGS